MLFGNTWLSCAAMQHFGTAMVTTCLQIRTVTHGGPVRCKWHCMPRVRAPSPGCLRFHIFRSKRMSSGCVGTSTPPPTLMKRVSHMLGGTSLVLQGESSYGVLQELHDHCDDRKRGLPPLPRDKQEVEPAFVLLKSMAPIGRAALEKPKPAAPPSPCCRRCRCSGNGTTKIHRGGL